MVPIPDAMPINAMPLILVLASVESDIYAVAAGWMPPIKPPYSNLMTNKSENSCQEASKPHSPI